MAANRMFDLFLRRAARRLMTQGLGQGQGATTFGGDPAGAPQVPDMTPAERRQLREARRLARRARKAARLARGVGI